ncbi:MAG: hypothetical protein SVY53_14745 [Chloroflexota bacterium]|nr:hypothetical protein [Chloroflexota bacterium]
MNNILLFGIVVASLVILVAALAIPAVAYETNDNEESIPAEDAWYEMSTACCAGDWERMREIGEEMHWKYDRGIPYDYGTYGLGNERGYD